MPNAPEITELEKVRHKIVQGCTRCGFCTFFCPVYRETLNESFVARGKIALMREVMAGGALLEPGLLDHMDTCLLCRACVEHCPTKVETDAVVLAARADGVSQKTLSFPEKILFRHVLSRRKTFGRVVKAASTTAENAARIRPVRNPSASAPYPFRSYGKEGTYPQAYPEPVSPGSVACKPVTPPHGIEPIAPTLRLFAGCGMEYLYPRDRGANSDDSWPITVW